MTVAKVRIDLDHLPPEIREGGRCILWNNRTRDGKLTKIPYQPRRPGAKAAVDDPATWGTFAEARTAFEDGKGDGVGRVLGDGLIGVDLDGCRDPKTGTITPEALAMIRALDSYTEVSPSGNGVHILVHGSLPPGRRRKGKTEMYDAGRFFTLTGMRLEGTPATIEERTRELGELHTRVFGGDVKPQSKPTTRAGTAVSDDDRTVVMRACSARNGAVFSRLWAGDASSHPSPSEADLALCNLLAFWTGADAGRMDEMFRQSGLMRPKWDEKHGAQTYGALTIGKALADCRETYRGEGTSPASLPSRSPAPPGAEPAELPPTSPSVMATAHLTDTGNGQRLVERHGTRFRWCETWGCFLVWDGRRWAKEDGGQLVRWAKDTIRALYGEAGDMADETLRKAFYTHALRSENDARLRAMIHLAQSEEGIPIAPEALDRDPWLLNVQNGTLDLRTGEVRAHLPADLITKLAPVEYDPTAAASTWDGFLDRIFAGNRMMMRYVQQAAGYSLTGKTGEQFWLLLHGRGMNGKSTLLRTFVDLLGDYATWTPTTTLLVRRGEGIDNDLARLRGARFVAAVETEGGRRLAEALVKQMTGGDKIAARFLYSEYFEFAPEFKLWLATNHRPEIRGTDWATWRRVRLIPFEVEIPEAEQDKDLLEKLQAEFSGILRWAVDGCLAWQREGLGLPDAVRQATAEYRASMDVVGNFLTECCQDIPHVFSKAGDLYRAYLTWCEDAKEHPESQRRFGEALAERGYTRDRGTAGVKGWRGITLSSDRSDRSDLLSGKFQK